MSIRVVVADDHILVLVRAGFRRLVDSVPSLPPDYWSSQTE